MAGRGVYEDLSGILYTVPFVLPAVYGLYLWVTTGLSAVLPSSVYLTVTRDPYVFIFGSLAVMLAVAFDTSSSDPADRLARVGAASDRLQKIAVASLVLAALAAWYSNGFVGVSGTATDFIVVRYSLVFPLLMVLLSYLVTVQVKYGALRSPKVLGAISLLLAPAVVYEVGKRDTSVGLGIAAVLVAVGISLFVRKGKKAAAQS